MLHCHVNIHFDDGMIAFFHIHKNEHVGTNGHGWGAAPANFSIVPAPKAIGPVSPTTAITEASNIRLPDVNMATLSTAAKNGGGWNATASIKHGVWNATTASIHGMASNNKTVWFGKPLPPTLKIGVTMLKDHDPRAAVGKTARHA
ncbi:hypothetical protein GGF32_008305 [Allomyces javanicus]|nr:hypothetical protein GGF32_008305 [Allomyces javanicus]